MKPSIFQHIRDTAYSWHSGMWSPLYAFASSGIVEDKDALLSEIKLCIEWVRAGHNDPENLLWRDLETLRYFVAHHLEPRIDGSYLAPWAHQYLTDRRAA